MSGTFLHHSAVWLVIRPKHIVLFLLPPPPLPPPTFKFADENIIYGMFPSSLPMRKCIVYFFNLSIFF
uniref:Uncharacterized protein n=1 Tax=Octopus bimaculoides TaxID=37653 RepID=A0A0L8HT47_OCTBM